ncbi:MAG TPA: DegQ family serine endoprotease [Casimicrobiaceae bacterium]|nr:DegQ family serine endoprotease [Casimicrobiaceae bacterium]
MPANMFKRNAVALALAGVFALGGIAADRIAPSAAFAAGVPTAPPSAAAINAAPVAALPDFSGLVERYGPAVVNISVMAGDHKVIGEDESDQGPDLQGLPPEFRQFFHNFQMPRRGPTRGVGSGFIVDPNGIVITNAHVVDGADVVDVKLTDKREFKAKVLGVDKATDIAVLKIDAKDLPVVRTGNPNQTKVGEWVVAIGQPFGFENTVTSGIVSAKSRALPEDSYVRFIQTDAAVNPGNSGGPLFNMRGEVIGVNSQIFSRSGGSQGLAFAIPIDVAMHVEQQIVEHGKVSHGRLGVMIQDVNQALAENFGLAKPSGALVSSVQKGSAGEKAGLKPGDVIVKLNGEDIAGSSDLPPKIASLKPGSSVTLEVWRNGAPKELTATLGAMNDKTAVASSTDKQDLASARLGIAVRPLTPEERRDNDLPGGLVVQDVAGAAERAGVRPGDVIVAVNTTPVKDVAQLKELVAKSGKTVALLVQRDNAQIFIPVTLG